MLSNNAIKIIENSLKIILLGVLFISPLIFAPSLYFPHTSGKVYFFRLMIELALILWAIILVKKPESRPKMKNPLIIALLIFTTVLVITAFTGIDPIRSFFSNNERSDGIIQYAHYILYFLMTVSVFKTKKDWQIILSVFILTALINCIYAFSHYSEQPRLFGLLGNSSYLGAFLIFAIGFCLLFFINSFKPFIGKIPLSFVFLFLGLIALFLVVLVLTQTRGAYLGVFVGFILFVILANFFLWKKNKKLIIALNTLLLIGFVFAISIFVLRDSAVIKKFPLIQRIANTPYSTSVADRLAEWKAAWNGFKDKPFLGWGPEDFDVVANKYYNYRVGLYQPWFDRPHNQALQYLAEGGIALFSAYLFLIGAVLYSISKIYKKDKTLGSLLFAVYAAYIIQSLIFFYALPILLGLFTLFAFIYFQTEQSVSTNTGISRSNSKNPYIFYLGIGAFLVSILIILRFTVLIPFLGNKAILENYKAIAAGEYKNLLPICDKAFSYKSPYLYVDARRAIGWNFLGNVLNKQEVIDANRTDVINLYEKIIPELQNWLRYRPVDQQVYFVLGGSYRLGFERLGKQDDLAKAETILKEALNYSSARIEYIDELGQVLVLQGKFDELDALMKNFVAGLDVNDPYRYLSLGNSYFIQDKYDLAMQEYEKARDLGQRFWDSDRDYYRYLQTAQELKNWQKVVDMTQEYLRNRGEDADTLYNLAVGYYYLGDKTNAQKYFNKAAALKSEFEQFRSVFFQ